MLKLLFIFPMKRIYTAVGAFSQLVPPGKKGEINLVTLVSKSSPREGDSAPLKSWSETSLHLMLFG